MYVLSAKCYYNPDKVRWDEEKVRKYKSLSTKWTNNIYNIRILVSLHMAVDYSILFFIIRRIVRSILSDIILPHAALVAEEEHFINLLLVILRQCPLLNNEPSPNLFKLLFLSLGCCPELFQLLLQLVLLPFSILVLGFRSLFILLHPTSLKLCHLRLFLHLIRLLLYFCSGFPNTV